MQEIERKFLVSGNFKEFVTKQYHITQGFLSTVPERTIRIRITDQKGYITIKGKSNKSGTTRFEWEKEIPLNEATQLLPLCEPTIIEKIRYIIPSENELIFEIDEFLGENLGLFIAEIELPTDNFEFIKPTWIGKEVTGQLKYYNSMLARKPYTSW